MKWPLSKLYKITPPTRLHLISRDKPDSFSSRRSLLVAAFSYIIKKCIPPHSSCYTLGTFSRLEEGFYRYALCKKLACSAQLSQSAKSDFYTQQTPPWHADVIGAGWRSQTKGESRKRTKESLLSSGRFRLSPATGNTIRQSSSFVLLYARHLLPFGRRLLSLCALQET